MRTGAGWRSIEARARVACLLIAAMALLSLALSGRAARDLTAATAAVEGATATLAAEQRFDGELRRVRAAIGDATRRAERGTAVGRAEWSALRARLDALEAMGPAIWDSAELAGGPGGRLGRATGRFGAASRRLIDAAQAGNGQGAAMPAFLDALREVEAANLGAGARLATAARADAGRSAGLTERWIATVALSAVATLATVLALALWFQRRVAAPLRRIARALGALAADGPADPLPEAARDDEVGALARGVSAFGRTEAERRDALRRLDHLAHHDSLTGLANRMSVDRRLAELIGEGGEVALLCVDLDRFKRVNDTGGHAAGDEVLREVAALLRATCGPGALVGRMGGDEFAILQWGLSQPAAARDLAERLLAAAAAGRDRLAGVGFSIGVAAHPHDAPDAERLRHAADVALYRVKRDGGGRAGFAGAAAAHEEGGAHAPARLAHAIGADELRLHYQPKLRLRTRRIDGVEALVRWRGADGTLVPPDRFVPEAERTGAIRPLTEWTLERAVADQRALHRAGRDVPVHVNLSGRLLGDRAFVRSALAILAGRVGVVGLEITETGIVGDPDEVLANLHAFTEAGIRLSIDDYGAGMSSLDYLKRLPAHELKIDRAFVAEVARSRRDQLLVKSTIDLAHALGMEVVAEGVECEAALAMLRAMGCDLVQGWLVARPMPLENLVGFLGGELARAG